MQRNKSKVTPINRVLTNETRHVVAQLSTSPPRSTSPAFNVSDATLVSSAWACRRSSSAVRARFDGCARGR
ncbi:MAG TPA: hypothetical protein VGZ04_06870 [Acidimicrobiales bacterium]|nr:hypothetical protein [Acidimicrobiales bacterium]